MKFLNIFILLAIAGSALGGGTSPCGLIHDNFVALLQVVEESMDAISVYMSGCINYKHIRK
jgi:hypothetical protein